MGKYKGKVDVSSIKRLYFDIVIKKKCPKCGKEIIQDYNDDYLSHIGEKGVEEISIGCYECDSYFIAEAKIKTTIEIELISEFKEDL